MTQAQVHAHKFVLTSCDGGDGCPQKKAKSATMTGHWCYKCECGDGLDPGTVDWIEGECRGIGPMCRVHERAVEQCRADRLTVTVERVSNIMNMALEALKAGDYAVARDYARSSANILQSEVTG